MKRITFITGHYGSGKSEVATNLAIQTGVDVIVDLDIVNPYFRSRELQDVFDKHNIKLVSSTLESALGSDLPYISPNVFNPFINKDTKAIFDLGGDGVGARMLRQFSDYINEEIDLLLCINIYREETNTANGIIRMIRSIESSGGIKVTGLINNTNLLRDTTIEDLKKGEEIIKEVSKTLNLDIVYTCIGEYIDNVDYKFAGKNIRLKLYLRKHWL